MTKFRITTLALATAALIGAFSMASAPASARGFGHGGMHRSHGFAHRHFGGHRRFGHRHWHGHRWGYGGGYGYGYYAPRRSCWRWRYGERVWVCGGGGGGYSIRRYGYRYGHRHWGGGHHWNRHHGGHRGHFGGHGRRR